MNPTPITALSSTFLRNGGFEVERGSDALRVRRARKLPSRGLLRLVIPRVVATVRATGSELTVRVRPDGLAWLVVVILVGGVLVEALMDRAQYPREYPPEFIYGASSAFGAFLVLELVRTRRAVRAVLDAHGR